MLLHSRILYGCVDWNFMRRVERIVGASRILYGCVDWNLVAVVRTVALTSRILYGCVDWNFWERLPRTPPRSRILYGCVDWNVPGALISVTSSVASFTGAWIETDKLVPEVQLLQSHPLRVRGLKQHQYRLLPQWRKVASFTGAWIETLFYMLGLRAIKGRILYGCVDWNKASEAGSVTDISRILYGCVDWNLQRVPCTNSIYVASFTDATRSFFRAFKSSSFQST